ncbi:MAG: exodeoxyribonuclease III, partial [Candidatus Eremiobacteraeota bacterium]|nr:exodeoxyribonuclease III [Candidatus Eremiobacteraeota bacterium]
EAQDADVVCVQETKAQEHQLPPEATGLTGWHTAYVDAEKKGYSGVAIFSRHESERVTRGLGMDDMAREGRFVRMDFAGGLSVASLYVPSGTTGPARQAVKYAFLDRFIADMARMRNEGRPVIVCGDYNIAHLDIDVYNPKACQRITGFLPPERAWFDRAIHEVGWVDAFRTVDPNPKRFTWWAGWRNAFEKNLGWRIDYQLITPDLAPAVRAASIAREPRFSDHAPVTIDYAIELS